MGVLTLPTVVTHAQAPDIALALTVQVAAQTGAAVTLDASALQQFDSSVLAVMLSCRRNALAAGKNFSVQGSPAKLSQLAGLYGVAELITAAS